MSYQLPSTFVAEGELALLEDPHVALSRYVRVGLIIVAALVIGLFGLAALVQTTGAVIASGEVTVESRVKQIAHPTGGVIAEVFVREGDHVKRGQPLMRLDSTVSGESASRLGESLEQLLAQRGRLTAERDGLSGITWPAELLKNKSPSARTAMQEESRLFSLRQQARFGEQAQYAERIRQTQSQIESLQAQMGAADKQAALIRPERDGVRSLYKRGLVTITRLNQLERTAVDLEGTSASLSSQIAEARGRIAELRQQQIEAQQNARGQAGAELGAVLAKLSDQQIRSVAADDAVDRSVLTAPYDGIIDKLAYATIGGVVPPTQTIMEVVPDNDKLLVQVRINPADIDQLRIDQPAVLRFSAFSAQTTPELNGKLIHVSAERTNEERTGLSYYKAQIEVSDSELRRLGGLKLLPGMPVEAFVQTTRRSLLSYITKPLRDQFSRAFREN